MKPASHPAPADSTEADTLVPAAIPKPEVLRLRNLHRAVADLRRGTPVLLSGEAPLILVAAETAGPRSLAELATLSARPAVLLLAALRGAAVLHQPVEPGKSVVALRLDDELLAPGPLRALTDPTVVELLPRQPGPAPVPELAPAALVLAKLGRLLPAVLAAPARPDVIADPGRFGLFSVPAADLRAYPVAAAAELRQIAAARVPLENAPDSRVIAFRTEGSAIEHLAILVGHPESSEAPLVRIHSECFTGDLLGSLRCDCGTQLRGAIARMAEEGAGVLLYLAQEGRNIGLINKLRAYNLQDRGLDTLDANRALGWEADERNFLIAARMLKDIGVDRIRLLTNNPFKLEALAACGINVVGREAHAFAPNGVNDHYLATKAERFGHLLD
jgi:GTP cyclohydrolase II